MTPQNPFDDPFNDVVASVNSGVAPSSTTTTSGSDDALARALEMTPAERERRNKFVELNSVAFTYGGKSITWNMLRGFAPQIGQNWNWIRPGLLQSDADRALQSMKNVFIRFFSEGSSKAPTTPPTVEPFDIAPIDDVGGGGGGGGGGSSGIAPIEPQFIARDESEVREQVRNYVVATTGTANQTLIDQGVATFQSKSKEAFDSVETKNISPWQAVKEYVRGTSAYGAVHGQRPDFVDEMDWVTSKQAKFVQLGISAARAEDAGISAAISGSTNEAMGGRANVIQVQGTGRLLQAQREQLKQSANAALGLV